MLANRLNVLLAERQLQIKTVVQDTGLSRNAISNIVNNPEANVSTTTIDKLCGYLGTTPGDFFLYSPYSIQYKANPYYYDAINIGVVHNRKERLFTYEVNVETNDLNFDEEASLEHYDLYILVESNMDRDPASFKSFLSVYRVLPPAFQNAVTKNMVDQVQTILKKHYQDIKVRITTAEQPAAELTPLNDYLKSLGKEKATVIIKFPWTDVSRMIPIN
ncbi:MAG: helix-turn-helix transcriptional regulator [Schleiferilactobacillus harbinensis]|uniref:helix-turn-helix domain-containing protein n=1 Tax=Schleiferilactobacillus harbinensis TaxID=304207 RepID=UPI0039EB3E76